jgi:Transposase DDE domain
MGDRESDIYEEFARKPAEVDQLIRAAQDRCLADGRMLFGCLDEQPELGRVKIDLPAAPGRAARAAVLALRAGPVEIARPNRPKKEAARLPKSVAVTLVEACEIDPPSEEETAHWRLLTTHTVNGLADARTIVGYYRERWTIEQLFRTYKTQGFNIEAVRIADEKPFETLAAATLIAAVQVLQLVRDRDGLARRPLEDVFDPHHQAVLEAVNATQEGKTERQKNPHPQGSLAYAAWVCARLGGWTGYYGKPGPIVMPRGCCDSNRLRRAGSSGHLPARAKDERQVAISFRYANYRCANRVATRPRGSPASASAGSTSVRHCPCSAARIRPARSSSCHRVMISTIRPVGFRRPIRSPWYHSRV